MVRGGGQVSRLTTTGFSTAIVTGGFNVSFFSEVFRCPDLFCEQAKIRSPTITIKNCGITV